MIMTAMRAPMVGCCRVHPQPRAAVPLRAGTVCILGRAEDSGQAAVDRIVAAYQDATQHRSRVFTGSSSGSAAFGYLRVRRRLSNES